MVTKRLCISFNCTWPRSVFYVSIDRSGPSYIITTLLTIYHHSGLGLIYVWWLCMAINITVQYYGGGVLPDMILLTQDYHHRGTRLNTMKWLWLYSLCDSILLLPCMIMYYIVFVLKLLSSGNPFKCHEEVLYLNKNQNAPRSSEHPPVRGENMSKRLVGGIKGCKYKTSSWHLDGFPDGNSIGSTV